MLQPIKRVAIPFDTVHIDYLGLFCRSKKAWRYTGEGDEDIAVFNGDSQIKRGVWRIWISKARRGVWRTAGWRLQARR